MGICIPDHPLSQCFENVLIQDPADIPCIKNVSKDFHAPINILTTIKQRKSAVIYTNMIDYFHVCVRYMNPSKRDVLRELFLRDVLRYSNTIQENIHRLYRTVWAGAKPPQYNALHIRCGDAYLKGGVVGADNRCVPFSAEMDARVEKIRAFLGKEAPIVLFCDYMDYKKYLAEKYGFVVFEGDIIHTGSLDNKYSIQSYIDCFSEFVLLGRASKIFAITVSNFSRVNSFLNNVPLYSFGADDEIIQHHCV